MATQSLYRRYRPRRFSELKGQDHIVQALRSSVEAGREGQAYLFSGPRGTGKTSTARIMAKVLNCANPEGGEPCCECASCVSVEQGTSYDVHELDAASNNGVDAMRDLIEKASLGTPGRHRVYILDEVHMLSKGAEAALLKTLEEPPPHVVFVLATTDPQKMSDTIRSRTQHLQFHLLASDTLQAHVRWVAEDAGLTVSDEAIEQVIADGAGSPRDTLSALELMSNSGGVAVEVIALDEFVEAMIDADPGRALKMVAHAISRGRDPRTVTEELIRFLRNGFLSLMAPELVQLPSQRIDALTDLARRLGPPGLVRGVEVLGGALTEMRNAPDPRVLLDVAIVQLTSVEVGGDDIASLTGRVQRLERQMATGPAPAVAAAAAAPAAAAPVADAATGRAKLGSRAGAATAASESSADTAVDDGEAPSTAAPAAPAAPTEADVAAPTPPESVPAAAPESTEVEPAAVPVDRAVTETDWDAVRPELRGITRAMFAPATFVSATGTLVVLALPNDAHRAKCEQHVDAVEQALSARTGLTVTVELVADGGPEGGGASPAPTPPSAAGGSPASSPTPTGSAPAPDASTPGAGPSPSGGGSATALAREEYAATSPTPHLAVVEPIQESGDDAGEPAAPAMNGRAIAEQARAAGPPPDPDAEFGTTFDSLPDDDDVDLDDLVDAAPEDVKTPMDRLGDAFPGSTLVQEDLY